MEQCKYAYKQCMRTRVMKKDGELHRLCEYHRDKANALQRSYATKRRQERRAEKAQQLVNNQLSGIEPMPFERAGDEQQEHDGIPADDLACLFDNNNDRDGGGGRFSDGEELTPEQYAYIQQHK
ncbi:Aste57867_135 [Aphanomyces stellatus]|uniref:Aste57867_135 protein n=1 Tax=Aphanomyces stellatus TaxID=120398 RepID=A0A485K701_9STRA|nr:hypothetical protein As57867_000135 [Aphanomyces stellatus]VFT77361.1 Aste57867_135 [Aphanomyces stellatus]